MVDYFLYKLGSWFLLVFILLYIPTWNKDTDWGNYFSEQLLYLGEELFRIKISFFEAGTSAQHQFFQKSFIFEKANFLENIYSVLPTFLQHFFRRVIISQLRFLSIATLTIYQLVIKWAQHQLPTLKLWEFFIEYLISWLHKVLNCYFLNESFYFLRTPIFFQSSYTFSRELLFQKMLFIGTANFRLLISFFTVTLFLYHLVINPTNARDFKFK